VSEGEQSREVRQNCNQRAKVTEGAAERPPFLFAAPADARDRPLVPIEQLAATLRRRLNGKNTIPTKERETA